MKELTKIFKKKASFEASESFEKRILTLLHKGLKPEEIFNKIKNHPNREEVGRFLYNFGMDKTLFDFSVYLMKKKQALPWPYILKLLIKHKITPNKKLEQILFHHWLKKKENHSSFLFACKEWGNISSQFKQMREAYLQELEEKNISEEGELLEQLGFVQAKNLIKEEEEIITKLLIINPKSQKYKKLKKDFEEKQALLTIQEQKMALKGTDFLEDYSLPLSDNSLKEKWFEKIYSISKENPEETKNLSIFLYFCAWPDKALSLLERYITRFSDYWFYLEWTLEAKQYTKGLELINYMLAEREEGSKFFLPLIYIKSQILYVLGRKNEAIEYLTTISKVQPDYKSTQYLLDKWLKNV